MEMTIQEAQHDALMNQVNEIADKLAWLRDMKAEIKTLEKEVKDEILEILETGELPEVEGVKIKIRYTRYNEALVALSYSY